MSHVRTQKRAATWNIDEGYDKNVKHRDSYPFRAIDAGVQYSLIVILKIDNNDIDYLCGGTKQGFQVGFHSPSDIPRSRRDFFNLSPNRAAYYSIEPRYTKTDSKLRQFDPHQRQCYFTNERKLRFYKQYTRIHCVGECLSNYTLAQCGCVHLAMLRM